MSALVRSPRCRPLAAAIALGALALAAAPGAFAQEAAPPAEPARSWYGWQTLLIAGVSDATIVGSIAAEEGAEVLVPLGIAGYVLGGPVVHFAHENVGEGFASLGLNVGTPLLCGLLAGLIYEGARTDHHRSELAGLGGLAAVAVGVGIGMLAAPILDAALLAYEEEPVTAQSGAPLRRSAVAAPQVVLGGSF